MMFSIMEVSPPKHFCIPPMLYAKCILALIFYGVFNIKLIILIPIITYFVLISFIFMQGVGRNHFKSNKTNLSKIGVDTVKNE